MKQKWKEQRGFWLCVCLSVCRLSRADAVNRLLIYYIMTFAWPFCDTWLISSFKQRSHQHFTMNGINLLSLQPYTNSCKSMEGAYLQGNTFHFFNHHLSASPKIVGNKCIWSISCGIKIWYSSTLNTLFIRMDHYFWPKGSPAGYWLYCPDFDSHLFCY